MLKPMFALVAVTLVASFFLGLVFTITEEPIRIQKENAEKQAIVNIIKGTDRTELLDVASFPSEENATVSKITKCFDVNGAALGYVFSVSPKGYGGSIDMMVGISGEAVGTVEGVEIIKHAETPGLGANADTPEFTAQYMGKTGDGALSVTKVKPPGENEIEAIASATITTVAVTDGVNEALAFYAAHQLGVE
jgi:electron transport complex protein RnfG